LRNKRCYLHVCFDFCSLDCCRTTQANVTRNSNSVSRTIIPEHESARDSRISNPKIKNSTIVIPLPLTSLNEDPTKRGEMIDILTSSENAITPLFPPSTLPPRPYIIPFTNNINTTNRPPTSTPRVINVDPIERREIRTTSNQIENIPLQPNTLSSTSFNVNYRQQQQQQQQAHNKHYNEMQ
jgi:hypothetical protein